MQFDTGIGLGVTDTGAPTIKLFRFDIDQGRSRLYLGEHWVFKIMAAIVNNSLKPLSLIADIFTSPFFNFAVNNII